MTQPSLDDYRAIAPAGTVDFLRRLSERVRNRRLLNLSASREVGGVAEILRGLVPLLEEVGVESAWESVDPEGAAAGIGTQRHPIPQFMIYPAIDPLSDKNRELAPAEVAAICDRLSVPRDKPILLQVGRFDRFKDPLGVIEAYRLVKRQHDCRLVLVGGAESDDPEGVELSAEVREAASHDPDLHVLELPGEHVEVNALQRAATIVLQKSTREGFGLGVAEAMWKSKPVIGGFAGGITAQVVYGVTGYTVNSVEGAAFRARQLLADPELRARLGAAARGHVRQHFLLTRHLGDMLALMTTLGR